MSKIFHTLEYEAFRAGITPRTEQSRKWFMERAAQLRSINRNQLMKEEPIEIRNQSVIGSMYMFFYDAKHKETLPYYDKFPLVIVLQRAPGGFLGLNLHYLPPALRAKFLDALLETTNNDRYDETTKFKLTYDLVTRVARMKYYKACIHHYLGAQVRSKFARVPAPEWEIATFLPTADFVSNGKKYNIASVYKDSKGKI